jgi:hypothetical protein
MNTRLAPLSGPPGMTMLHQDEGAMTGKTVPGPVGPTLLSADISDHVDAITRPPETETSPALTQTQKPAGQPGELPGALTKRGALDDQVS